MTQLCRQSLKVKDDMPQSLPGKGWDFFFKLFFFLKERQAAKKFTLSPGFINSIKKTILYVQKLYPPPTWLDQESL